MCNDIPTDQNESHGNHESENISPDGLVVFSVSFGKEVEPFVDVVLAKSLGDKSELNSVKRCFLASEVHFLRVTAC